MCSLSCASHSNLPSTPLSLSVGLWNYQSAVNKTDFIHAFASQPDIHILGLTETWNRPEDSATPTALSTNYSFSHSPHQTGKGGGTGPLHNFIEELDVVLSSFPGDGGPLVVFGDFNIHLEKPYASDFHILTASFILTRLASPQPILTDQETSLISTHP